MPIINVKAIFKEDADEHQRDRYAI